MGPWITGIVVNRSAAVSERPAMSLGVSGVLHDASKVTRQDNHQKYNIVCQDKTFPGNALVVEMHVNS